MSTYARWFSRLVWLGIGVNILFVIPLLFFPEALLSLLKMQIPVPIIWVRLAGFLLLTISIFYIPVAINPYRYQATAWVSVLVTRGGVSTFFLSAVFFFDQEWGFLTIALTDFIFGIAEGILLFLAQRAEPEAFDNPAKGYS